MKKIITAILLFFIINTTASAVEFDSSIDASIRKDYNVEENDLPPLPSGITASENPITSSASSVYKPTGKTYTLKHGTQINLSSQKNISDWQQKGYRISFAAKQGIVSKEGAVIPSGTIFKGIITDSHRPQITGNGGLIELKIDEIYYNGIMSKIETKVSLANSKKVFRGNIKGQRLYWKNFSKVMTPGKKVFSATQTCASVMAPIPVVNILSVVPLITGAAVYTVNLAAAPIIAVFTKGGSLSLPAGTNFNIKILNDTQIQG